MHNFSYRRFLVSQNCQRALRECKSKSSLIFVARENKSFLTCPYFNDRDQSARSGHLRKPQFFWVNSQFAQFKFHQVRLRLSGYFCITTYKTANYAYTFPLWFVLFHWKMRANLHQRTSQLTTFVLLFSSFMLKAVNEVLWWSRCWPKFSSVAGSCIPQTEVVLWTVDGSLADRVQNAY